jgi:cytochrome b561
MRNPHSPEHYTRIAIMLHWLIGSTAVGLLILGATMVWVPRQTLLRGELFDLHKSVGLLVLLLMLFRLGWRATHKPPSLAGLPPLSRFAARSVHGLFYALLVLQPLTGYLASAFGAYGVSLFGLNVAPFGHPDLEVRRLLLTAHHLFAWLLTALILLHVLAAYRHRYGGGSREIAARMTLRRLGIRGSGARSPSDVSQGSDCRGGGRKPGR